MVVRDEEAITRIPHSTAFDLEGIPILIALVLKENLGSDILDTGLPRWC